MRHGSSNAVRFAACLMLFLSVAPMASIYVLFFSLGNDFSSSTITKDNFNNELQHILNNLGGVGFGGAGFGGGDLAATQVAITLLSNMLHDLPNSTMDELWSSVFHGEALGVPSLHPFASLPSSMYFHGAPSFSLRVPVVDFNSYTAHHWAIVIPWMISIFFGLVFPALLSILSFLESRYYQRRRLQHLERRRQRQNGSASNNYNDNDRHNYHQDHNEDNLLYDYEYYYDMDDDNHTSSYFDYFSFFFPISKERQRLIKLCASTKMYSKTLTEEDVVKGHHGSCYDDYNDDAATCWRIPSPGVRITEVETNATPPLVTTTPVTTLTATSGMNTTIDTAADTCSTCSKTFDNNKTRDVVEMCAICLTPYTVGDKVVWSSNPECVHCFHKQCILSWLLKARKRKKQQCPCCRQPFILKSKSCSSR